MSNLSDFGKTLRSIRLKSNVLQKDIYKSAEISPITISKWENGVEKPSFNRLKQYLDVCKADEDTQYKMMSWAFELKLPKAYKEFLEYIRELSMKREGKDKFGFLDYTAQAEIEAYVKEKLGPVLKDERLVNILSKQQALSILSDIDGLTDEDLTDIAVMVRSMAKRMK